MIVTKIKSLIQKAFRAIRRIETAFSAAKQLRELAGLTENPFFVIIMPGSLHILKVFMRYAPETVNFVFVLNGIDKWEKNWLHAHYPGFREITLTETREHGKVLDLFFDNFKKPFGIVDSDCFVFNPQLFKEIEELPENALLNALFYLKNEKLDLEIPQTYFLFFNTPAIRPIKKKFHVNSNVYHYRELNKKVKTAFYTLGIDSDNLPETTKLFDTFRVILLLGFTEGYKVNFINKLLPSPTPNSEIYHIGASHFNNNSKNLTYYRGSYFWRYSLERSGDPALIDYYHRRWGTLTSKELLALNPIFAGYGSTLLFTEYVDKIINGDVENFFK